MTFEIWAQWKTKNELIQSFLPGALETFYRSPVTQSQWVVPPNNHFMLLMAIFQSGEIFKRGFISLCNIRGRAFGKLQKGTRFMPK